MHVAVCQGHVHICQYLLYKKADTTIKNTDGQTCIDLSKAMKKEMITSILSNKNSIYNSQSTFSNFMKREAIINEALILPDLTFDKKPKKYLASFLTFRNSEKTWKEELDVPKVAKPARFNKLRK